MRGAEACSENERPGMDANRRMGKKGGVTERFEGA